MGVVCISLKNPNKKNEMPKFRFLALLSRGHLFLASRKISWKPPLALPSLLPVLVVKSSPQATNSSAEKPVRKLGILGGSSQFQLGNPEN